MDFKVVCVVRNKFFSEAKRRWHIEIEDFSGNQFKFSTEKVDCSGLPVGLGSPVELSGKLGGRVMSGEKGPVQLLLIDELKVKAVSAG